MMVEELIIANLNQRKGIVVILSELMPEEVFNNLNETIKSYKNTKVIVRSGNPHLEEDL